MNKSREADTTRVMRWPTNICIKLALAFAGHLITQQVYAYLLLFSMTHSASMKYVKIYKRENSITPSKASRPW